MKITETAPKANLSSEKVAPRKTWDSPKQGACVRERLLFSNNTYVLKRVACHSLDCDYCGPIRRKADHERFVGHFAMHDHIWAKYVPSDQVAKHQRQAKAHGFETASVPVGARSKWNIVLSAYQWEDAYELSDEEVRRIFLCLRVSRRQLTGTGSWSRSGTKQNSASQKVLDIGPVSQEAFQNVARALKCPIRHRPHAEGDDLHFWDRWELGPERVGRMLRDEERRLREVRRARLQA